jgi:hypothetical protein
LSIVRGLSAGLLAGVLAASTPCFAATDTGSSTFQIDPAHDGSLTVSTPFAPPFKMHWSVDFGGPVSYPIVADNLVIVIADGPIGPHLTALDVATGKPVWQKLINADATFSYLASDSGTLFLSTYGGPLEAFTAATGKSLWATALPDESFFNFVPAAANGSVYASGNGSGAILYGVSAATGAVNWGRGFFGNTNGATIGPNSVIFSSGCEVASLKPANGRTFWDTNPICDGGPGLPAAYYAGKIYMGKPFFTTGQGQIVDATTGRYLGGLGGNPPAFYRKTSYTISAGTLVASNLTSGNTVWSFTKDTFSNPPIVVNNYVFSLSNGGTLYINNGSNGGLVASFNIGLGSLSRIPSAPQTGLGAGAGMVFVPSGSKLAAFGP